MLSSNSTGTSFPVTSSRTCWRRRQLPRNKLTTSYEEVSDTPDHLDMSRWSESRQLPRDFLVTSWRLPRNICYGEVTGKLVPVEFELYRLTILHKHRRSFTLHDERTSIIVCVTLCSCQSIAVSIWQLLMRCFTTCRTSHTAK